jgi:hypothetical protein
MDHEIACPSENELYVSELLNWRVQKLVWNRGVDCRQEEQTIRDEPIDFKRTGLDSMTIPAKLSNQTFHL